MLLVYVYQCNYVRVVDNGIGYVWQELWFCLCKARVVVNSLGKEW